MLDKYKTSPVVNLRLQMATLKNQAAKVDKYHITSAEPFLF